MVNEDVDTQIAIDLVICQLGLPCGCDCECPELATVMHPSLEKVMLCNECFGGLEAEFNAREMEKWICNECGEYRPDDARVEGDMKCGQCAYGGAMESTDDC